uniref:Uncharacterized protein n=1 Tax=Arundo donax TaxID=35708 RepID=A0A0A9B074_ARUDO
MMRIDDEHSLIHSIILRATAADSAVGDRWIGDHLVVLVQLMIII